MSHQSGDLLWMMGQVIYLSYPSVRTQIFAQNSSPGPDTKACHLGVIKMMSPVLSHNPFGMSLSPANLPCYSKGDLG